MRGKIIAQGAFFLLTRCIYYAFVSFESTQRKGNGFCTKVGGINKIYTEADSFDLSKKRKRTMECATLPLSEVCLFVSGVGPIR